MSISLHTKMVAVALFGAAASASFATTLTFEGTGTNVNIPGDWASNAAANGTGWNVDNGATPNVVLGWSHAGGTSSGWQFYNDAEWTGAAQLNDYYATDRVFDLLLTPDAGFMVKLESFVFDDYVDYAAGNDFKWTIFAGSSAGSVLAGGTATTTNGQNLHVHTGLGYTAGPILFRVQANSQPAASDGFDQALDDIVIQQQAVPEPATLAALALGVVAMVRRRRH